MGATSRRKGRRWENTIVAWFCDNGHPSVERNEFLNAQAGDILGIVGWSLEAKDHQQLALAGWVDQARRQAVEAGARFYACIVKRRGTTDPGDAYVVMPLSVFSEWVRDD